MKKTFSFMLLLLLLSIASVNAQVTIGSTNDPHAGAVLDLQSNSTKGLLLPKVVLTSATVWAPVTGTAVDGMMVYNTSASIANGLNGAGAYVWSGNKWNLVSGATATDPNLPGTPGSWVTPSGTTTGAGTSANPYTNTCPATTVVLTAASGYTLSNAVNGTISSGVVTFSTVGNGSVVITKDGQSATIYVTVTACINEEDYPKDQVGVLSMSGNSCYDTKETFDVNNNGTATARQNAIVPTGSFPYVVSATGKTISAVNWMITNSGNFFTSTVSSGSVNSTMTVTFKDIATIKALVDDSQKATAAQTLTFTAYVTYSDNSKASISKVVKVQDFICCDGAIVENGAWDYANGAAGDWAKGKTLESTANQQQQNNYIILDTRLGGAWNSTDKMDSYFRSTASGDMCWNKKDASGIYMGDGSNGKASWKNAVTNCANGSFADGDASAGWYLPNLKELHSLYMALPGTVGAAKIGDGVFFGGTDDAKAMTSANYWSSTEYNSQMAYYLYFNSGIRTNQIIPENYKSNSIYVRCARRM